jgi:hypothetical protein
VLHFGGFASFGLLRVFRQIHLLIKVGLILLALLVLVVLVVPILIAFLLLDHIPLLDLVLIVVLLGLDDKSEAVLPIEYFEGLDAV